VIIGQPATSLTPSDLRAYGAEHLAYELDMLHHAVQLGRLATDQVTVNVSVEQFALHLRNLIAFFWSSKRSFDTDVLAEDFCSPPAKWATVQAAHPLKGTVLEGARERAHQEIAHLTTHRIPGRPPAKVWDYAAILAALKPVVGEFLRVAAPDRVDQRLSGAVAALYPSAPVVPVVTTANLATDSPQSVHPTTTWTGPLATGPAFPPGNVPGGGATGPANP
jgi:hypothetical protein